MPTLKTSAPPGVLGWEEVFDLDFTAQANAGPPATDGGTLTVGTLTVGTDNGDGAGGRGTVQQISGTGLVITPAASTAVSFNTSTRTPPLVTVDLDDLGLTADDDLSAWILVQVAAYAPVASADFCAIGLEQTSAPVGSGGTGRGDFFGSTASGANVRPCNGGQVSGSIANNTTWTGSIDASGVRVWALRVTGRSIECFYSTSLDAMDAAPEDVLGDLTYGSTGWARWGGSMPTHPMRLLIAVGAASAATPPALTVQRIRVLARAVV